MAIFNTTFYSNALHRLTELTIILPVENSKGPSTELEHGTNEPLKTVMLLHGFSGTHTDWLYGSRIQALAMKHHIAVICPSGENSFYVDDTHRDAMYEQYLCEALQFAREVFSLDKSAESTAIGGLSMGGYGAIVNGLKHPELFGSIIALSSALITDKLSMQAEHEDNFIASASYFSHIFGRPQHIKGSSLDPVALAKKLVCEKQAVPRIFAACGTEDFLIQENNAFSKSLSELNITHTYITAPSIHDWAFWDMFIEKGLEWAYGN